MVNKWQQSLWRFVKKIGWNLSFGKGLSSVGFLERSSSGVFSSVEWRLIVYDHGLLVKLCCKFVPLYLNIKHTQLVCS
jgi:hypothetical protein